MPKRSRRKDEDEAQAAVRVMETIAHKSETARPKKNPAAVALGRRGGRKGGKVRAARLDPKRRSEIARLGALARWGRPKEED